MRLDLLRITNYMGIDNLEAKPGDILNLRGGNGKGKTTVIRAVRSMGEGGSEPESVNKDADEAVIKMVILVEDGDTELYQPGRYEITRTIRRDGYSLVVRNPKGVKIGKEKTFVETFLPKIGFDPVSFDFLTDEERAEKLQRFLRVRVTQEEIRKAAGLVELGVIPEEFFEDGIGAINRFDERLEKEGQDLRAVVKNLTGSINTFEASVEGKTAEDVENDLRAVRNAIAVQSRKLEAVGKELTSTQLAAFEASATASAEAEVTINDWYKSEVDKLMDEREKRRREVAKAHAEARQAATDAYNTGAVERLDPIKQELATLRGREDMLAGKAEEAAKLAGAQQQLDQWRDEKAKKAEGLERITIARQQLERLKVRKLATVSVDDLEIKGGKLYLDGLLSSQVNTARRLMKWVQIAAMFSDIPGQLMIVDELERLEAANRQVLENAIRESKLQLVCARLDDEGGPLRFSDSLMA